MKIFTTIHKSEVELKNEGSNAERHLNMYIVVCSG